MKKLLITAAVLALGMAPCYAALDIPNPDKPEASFTDTSWGELFKETENKVLDFAIASSFEAGYFRDLIEGRNAVGAQFPIVFLTKYASCDFGYVTGYDEKSRGSLMIGGSLRLDRLLEDAFPEKVKAIKAFLPGGDVIWNKLWFGPFVAHGFVADELLAGVKTGLRF